jgi:hypothetical protein
MYPQIDIDYNNFDIDDVAVILENIDEFIKYQYQKDNFPMSTVSFHLCKWHEYIDNTYLTFKLLIDLDDITDFHVRVSEGAYCDTNERIIETDAFIDIKVNTDSIQQAICDIHLQRIPLHNRDKVIDYVAFPYVVKND